ncbi:cyclin-like protein [Piromyces finnis]|uniref:Cyclin-like protein n=1 Tax=Piromyces finnis TaxID=1754191 RepID=A0A1Y1VAB9_9FUNG|nr:cyclin-like protein [Piromyces finnis]|eukprot:ORX51038.1 cyclin-like protein [Piromyces finnis]
MEFRKNKYKFPSGKNLSTYPYYNRNALYNNKSNTNNDGTTTRKNKSFERKENNWHFTSEELNTNTPSIKDGYTLKEELKQRWKACAFIMSIGITMKIPQTTIATACTFLHRFYCRKSLKYYPSYEIAAASLYLASKVTDTQRRLKDIIIVCISKAQKNAHLNINEKTHEFEKWKQTILFHELELLEIICCDIIVDHPYTYLLNMAEKFNDTDYSHIIKLAWCFINDSFKTTMCLKYSPQVIAASALYMACKYNKSELVSKNTQMSWWKDFNINEQELLKATLELSDVYLRIIEKNNPENLGNDKLPSSVAEPAKEKMQSTLQNSESKNTPSLTPSP